MKHRPHLLIMESATVPTPCCKSYFMLVVDTDMVSVCELRSWSLRGTSEQIDQWVDNQQPCHRCALRNTRLATHSPCSARTHRCGSSDICFPVAAHIHFNNHSHNHMDYLNISEHTQSCGPESGSG